jgi:hypothetical protein
VLFIAGMGRSGTTILDNVLGELPNFFSGGEINYLWQRGIIENSQCGCGVNFRDCNLWNNILTNAFGDLNVNNAFFMSRTFKSVIRTRYFPFLLYNWNDKKFLSKLEKYLESLTTLYLSMTSVTGCEIIIDSSKYPTYGAILGLMPEVDLYMIHVVRDPRAVAYSWKRKKLWDFSSHSRMMHRQNIIRTTFFWITWNFFFEILKSRLQSKYIFMRYEDFIKNPNQVVSEVFELLKCDGNYMQLVNNDNITLGTNHTVSGNPSRFNTGPVKLNQDNKWKYKMTIIDKLLVTLIAHPYLLKYNYSIYTNRHNH